MSMDSTQNSGSQDANPGDSNGGVERNSFDPEAFKKDLLATVATMFTPDNVAQSVKDKALKQVTASRDFTAIQEVLAEYKAMQAKGMTEEQIEHEYRLRSVEAAALSGQSAGKPADKTQTADPVTILIPALGLDANDADVVSILAGDGSLQEKIAGIVKVADRKKMSPNPALVSQPAGSGVKPPDNNALIDELTKLQIRPSANRARIAEIEKQLGW